MAKRYRIFVSSDNTPYCAWQSFLFCHSAISRLGQYPTVIVHQSSMHPVRAEYILLREQGCDVVAAPSFKIHPKGYYAPRNEIGSLLVIGNLRLDCERILFCEPDMIFTRPIEYDSCPAAEYYDYLDYSNPRVQSVIRKYHLDDTIAGDETMKIGVPYCLPVAMIQGLATKWLEVIDAFEELDWIDIMYAFGIALRLSHTMCSVTHIMDLNGGQENLLTRPLIHYCNSHKSFDKRTYFRSSPLDVQQEYLLPEGEPGTILGELSMQLREARSVSSSLKASLSRAHYW